jgi:hypothetical protein
MKDMIYEDMLIAVKTQNHHLNEAICVKYELDNACEIRGLKGDFELLGREKY